MTPQSERTIPNYSPASDDIANLWDVRERKIASTAAWCRALDRRCTRPVEKWIIKQPLHDAL
jgi:hypothetical protein